ncbi:succinyldiaminopimelate transaminase [Comamonas sp.]|uniref:succinyldiaminopimelate transaminase n=1 Tax=Comamonas sp. TaxID=34028 RepID=UPI00289ACA60|nr:succinyldiaminopimelate transaminase [Comamonas sp.]
MNPLLQHLQPYPFERLRQLFAGVTPPAPLRHISLGIGEPRHATPDFIQSSLTNNLSGLANYPATAGDVRLRQACSDWLQRRYGITVDAATQVLPVNGSREALFSFAQTIIDPSQPGATVLCPNPFYQIYEGAALLAGAQPYFVASDPVRNFAVDWDSVPADVWAKTQLMYVCSPGNPTGAVMPLQEWKKLFELSDRYGFVIASDECYSEIYFRDEAPLGGLEAAVQLGRHDFRNLVAFTSLSKRSNVPGLRSGFVAGDAQLLKSFLLYRTYHGGAMGLPIQHASIAAWSDEAHVVHNRALYKEKFAAVMPILEPVMDVRLPDAGFYLWPRIPDALGMSETEFARELFAQSHVTVLPGSYLARNVHRYNPGAQRVRLALVAETAECVEAAQRIADFIQKNVK